MDKLNLFSFEELCGIGASLSFTREHAEQNNALEVAEHLGEILNKLNPIIKERLTEVKTFGDIVENLLDDVDNASALIVANPDIEIPEYH